MKGTVQADGSVMAARVQVEDDVAEPEPPENEVEFHRPRLVGVRWVPAARLDGGGPRREEHVGHGVQERIVRRREGQLDDARGQGHGREQRDGHRHAAEVREVADGGTSGVSSGSHPGPRKDSRGPRLFRADSRHRLQRPVYWTDVAADQRFQSRSRRVAESRSHGVNESTESTEPAESESTESPKSAKPGREVNQVSPSREHVSPRQDGSPPFGDGGGSGRWDSRLCFDR